MSTWLWFALIAAVLLVANIFLPAGHMGGWQSIREWCGMLSFCAAFCAFMFLVAPTAGSTPKYPTPRQICRDRGGVQFYNYPQSYWVVCRDGYATDNVRP